MKHFECSYFPFHFVRLLSKCISKEMSVKTFCLYLTTDLLQTILQHEISTVEDPCHLWKSSKLNKNHQNGPLVKGEIGEYHTITEASNLA